MLKLKNKNVLVYGLAKSGIAAANLLIKKGANVYLYDDCKFTLDNIKKTNLILDNYELLFRLDEHAFNFIDLVVISPSVSVYSENIKKAYLHNVPVISELELGFCFLRGKVLAITGTNGKTTTVKLIEHILKGYNKNALAVGNVGFALSDALKLKISPKLFVVEVSSFQLEATQTFAPHLAAVLNIAPDHLDRHYTFKNYIAQKSKIFDNFKKNNIALLNADDEQSMALLDYIKEGEIYFYSTKKVVPQGVFLKEEEIFFKNDKKEVKLFDKEDIKLIGPHNLSNTLCAALMCYLCSVPKKYIKEGIKTFMGLPHRLTFVREINKVKYYNNSKATNIDATIKSALSFSRRVVLILGGSDKSEDFNLLFKNLPKNVKHIVVCGQNAKKILKAAAAYKFKQIKEVDSLKEAVKSASLLAREEEVVLLAPASASFDSFNNYEHRGEEFEKFVEEL